MCQGRLRGVRETFMGESRELKGYPKEGQMVFPGSFKYILRKCQECFRKVSSVFQEIFIKGFKDVSKIFK